MNSPPLQQRPGKPDTASNIPAIVNSIRYDPQVRQWFTTLICQQKVREKILKNQPDLTSDYRRFNRQCLAVPFWSFVVILIVSLSSLTRHPLLLWGVIPFASLALWFNRQKKENLYSLSRALLLLDDQPEDLSAKTLYQIAEIYSRTYQIPSLVDLITSWDRVLRAAILIVFVFCNLIYPVEFLIYASTLLMMFLLIQTSFRISPWSFFLK